MWTGDAANAVALIVEDEALIAMATEDVLSTEGFKTVVAYTEAEAQTVAPASLDVAVVDLTLTGDRAGPRIIQHLRSGRPNLPIVVVSGYSGSAPEGNLRGLGGPTVRLTKPTRAEDLALAVRDVVERDCYRMPSLKGRRRDD